MRVKESMRFFVLVFIFLFTSFGLAAQVYEEPQDTNTNVQSDEVESNSLDSASVPFYIQEDYLSYDIQSTDTSLINFQQCDPVIKNNLFVARGPFGLSHRDLLFEGIDLYGDLFDIGESVFPHYFFNWKENPIYMPTKTTSDVVYAGGENEEQYMLLTLTNPVSKTVYINLDYQLQNGLGDYINQKVRNKQFRSTVRYNTLNHRYASQFTFTRNQFENGENGGITDDSFYEDSTYTNRYVIPVNLTEAYSELESNTFFFSQSLALGKTKDSTSTIYPLGSVFVDAIYNSKFRLYDDKDQSFYTNFYLDSTATRDSLHVKQLQFRFGYDRYTNTDNSIKLKAWGEYHLNQYFGNTKTFRYDYFIPKAAIAFNWKGIAIRTLGSYQILMNRSDFSYGSNNYLLAANARQKIGENIAIDASFKTAKQSPMLQHFIFSTNHYMWDNSSQLKDKYVQELAATAKYKLHKAGVKFSTIENYTDFYKDLGTQQANNTLNHLSIYLSNDFRVPYFGAKSLLLYQKSSNVAAYSVPEFSGRLTIYSYFYLFNRVLKIEPGIDLYAVSTYYAPYFDPAMGRFAQQRDKKVEDQLYADVFINFKIKKARVFVKYQHFNTLFMDYNHFLTAHYPMQDAAIKFGVSWKFYN